jgi:glycosyltransferase involved in cell wall biosynthesis
MKIAYITAGAAGMYCGSCMHDNTLAAALLAKGHDALLIPTYTPIRTDEADVSEHRVFFGGINVYLQQKSALFRHTPWFLDRLLDFPGLLRWVSRFAVKTRAEQLGELTLSMLKGEHGHQRKEIAKLVRYLEGEVRPDIITFTNVLLSGMVRKIRERIKAPILGVLQGDDIYLESLPDTYRKPALQMIRENCRDFAGFIATSHYYADFMADYLGLPRRQIHVIHPGLNLRGYEAAESRANGTPFTIGYFARICPEKGLHILVEAFAKLKEQLRTCPMRLKISGWLGENNRPFLDEQMEKVRSWGLEHEVEYVETPDHARKVQFYRSIDVLSVPTVYREPKGLYVLEALAAGVPVVQPRHGSFPELIEATGGGLLVNPLDAGDLTAGLRRLLDNPEERTTLAQRGQKAVHERFHAARMADETVNLYQKLVA